MENYNQQSFTKYTVLDSQQTGSIPRAVPRQFMANVFTWMFVALGVSTLFAFLFAQSTSLFSLLYEPTPDGHLTTTGLGIVVMLAPLAFVFSMSLGLNKFSVPVLTLLFFAFAAVMGISLSSILLIYTTSSLLGCFAAAAVMFGVMAVMGYTTDKDLTSFGTILGMGLVGIIIASVINMFMHSEMMGYMVSILGVAIFTGLTAYDVQKLKMIGAGLMNGNGNGTAGTAVNSRKLALMGALNLYLDFINLFLFLLRLFGKRK